MAALLDSDSSDGEDEDFEGFVVSPEEKASYRVWSRRRRALNAVDSDSESEDDDNEEDDEEDGDGEEEEEECEGLFQCETGVAYIAAKVYPFLYNMWNFIEILTGSFL